MTIPEGWFTDDGCTGFFEGWLGKDWAHCCNVHDQAFATGTTAEEFRAANAALYECVSAQDPLAALLMFAGAMTLGAVFFFFGFKKRVAK